MVRIGQGFDAHAFVPDRPLVLGGVSVPHDKGLGGYSDADVLLHAVCDALLGAAGQGDLGRHFPGSDPRNADRDSREIVREVRNLLEAAGASVANVDATLVAQQPRLGPYVPEMEANLAADLQMPRDRVNVKATTTDHLGWTGRGEGIAALAVALIESEGPPPETG